MDSQVAGKTCIVTGATNGIGLVTAQALAQSGATVIGIGRNPARCSDTAARIQATSGNGNVNYLVADLSSQAQVRSLADQIKRTYPHVDVLVNNAGTFFASRQVSPDGIEMTWALNHLSYFLLTNLLLDVMKASAPARIVSVSSDAHTRAGGIRFDDPGYSKNGFSGWGAYAQSKLANIMFTYELSRRLSGTGVTANTLHPGFVATGFGHNNGGFVSLAISIGQRLGARSPEKGAETSIYLASSPTVESVTGKYYIDKRPVKSTPISYDSTAQMRLWKLSEDQTGM